MEEKKNKINRRDFLKYMGAGAATAAVASCAGNLPREQENAVSEREIAGEMTYRINPKTGDRVSLLGYGCMRLVTVLNGTTRDSDAELDQEAINRSVDYAIEHGVNYFDTAPTYCRGESEHAMGIALSRHPRQSYYIATKLSNISPVTWGRKESIEMYHNSMRQLQTDYIDYLLLHSIGGSFEGYSSMQTFDERFINNGMLEYLINERKEGRIRNLGFSYHGDIAVFDRLLKMQDDGEVEWDFVQIQLNYADWKHAREINEANTDAEYLYGELNKRSIPAVIMEPLLGGRLANLPEAAVAKMKQRRPNDSIASWAFRYAGTREGVLTVLSGMTYMEHLHDNLVTFSPLDPVTDEECEFLEEVVKLMLYYPTVPCTGCKYCMPCPYGINIPEIFAHYNKCLSEGNVIDNLNDKDYARARKAFLIGYDRSVPKLRQADHCIGCRSCVSHCPQGIAIPDELHKIDSFVERLKRNKG